MTASNEISEIFDPSRWRSVDALELDDITYHVNHEENTVRVAFDRPEVRNAFRPRTVDQLFAALEHARTWSQIGCVLITGNGPSPKDGGWAFSGTTDRPLHIASGPRRCARC